MPERILGHNPWRRAALFIILLSLIVLFLTAGLIDQRLEVQGLKEREAGRERSAAVTQAVQCFQNIADAPNNLALTALLDRNAKLRIQANRMAIKRDPDPDRNLIRRQLIRDDQGARRAVKVIQKRFLAGVQPLSTCIERADKLGLDTEALHFDLKLLGSISRDLRRRS